MTINLTIHIEAADLADLGRQLDSAVTAFRQSPGENEAATPATRKGRVSAAARAQAAGGDAGANGAAQDQGQAMDEGGLGADRGGPGDHLEAGEPQGAPDASTGTRRKANGRDKGGAQAADEHAAVPEEAPAGASAEQVGSGERKSATLAEVQSLAKALGAVEEKGVAAVQRIFAAHAVKTPKDMDPAKLDALREAFEAELAA